MSHSGGNSSVRTVFGELTDVGQKRRHNEDHILVREDLGLFVLADGMGGHKAGDVASNLAVSALVRFFETTVCQVYFGIPPEGFEHLEDDALRLYFGLVKANEEVHRASAVVGNHHGMGSTIVVVYVAPDGNVHIGHVGDSRCYRVAAGQMELLTEDHSFVNDVLKAKPDLPPEQLANLPANIITRALGMREDVEPSIRTEAASHGDVFVLCSDGLSGQVSGDEIHRIVGTAEDPQGVCRELVDASNTAGGRDNVSVIVLRIDKAVSVAS
ncbi:MAG: protein phosphatase 2C domain-containing protein [Polyangiaceae bacterium]|nr:protein phosphatase 2C domain-containing protein [Polyangiaceae bacterium]